MSASFAVILAAAGQSSRFNDPFHKKPFVMLDQKAVWLHSADRFLAQPEVRQVIIVVAPDDLEDFRSRFGANVAVLGIDVTTGGELRHDSVRRGLEKVRPEIGFVAVHDAARPCIHTELITACFDAAVQSGAAIPATEVSSTLKRSARGKSVDETVPRAGLYLAQTPQCFRRELLERALASVGSRTPTDEAEAVEWLGHPVTLVPGSPLNIKITVRQDLRLAAACLKALPAPKLDARPHPFADDNLWR